MKVTEDGNEEYKKRSERQRFQYVIRKTRGEGHDIKSARDFIKQYERIFEHKCFKQNTLAGKDGKFQKFGIIKENGKYTYKVKKRNDKAIALKQMIFENGLELSDIFISRVGTISRNDNDWVIGNNPDQIFFFRLKIYRGYEQMFCEIISETFDNDANNPKPLMIIPAYQSIVVISKDESYIKEIYEFISDRI